MKLERKNKQANLKQQSLVTSQSDAAKQILEAEKIAAKLIRDERNARGIESARGKLSSVWTNFLQYLNQRQMEKATRLRTQLEEDYLAWAEYFELLKTQFKEVWDFFGVVEKDVPQWFRCAPNSGRWDFLNHSREGYNFAVCLENNVKSNAPFPAKWMMISVAYLPSRFTGIGDEGALGRGGVIDDKLVGLERCQGKNLIEQAKAAAELRKKTLQYPLVFEMYSENVGQKYTRVPISVLEKHSLLELCKGLFAALNKDEMEAFTATLPVDVRQMLTWRNS